jgi:hypothetical protein
MHVVYQCGSLLYLHPAGADPRPQNRQRLSVAEQRAAVLIGGGDSLAQTYGSFVQFLAQQDPAHAAVLEVELKVADAQIDALKDQVNAFHSENDRRNAFIENNNLDVLTRVATIEIEKASELPGRLAGFDAFDSSWRSAELRAAIAEARLEALEKAEAVEGEVLAQQRGLSSAPEEPTSVRMVSGALGTASGIVLGVGIGQKVGQLDLTALDAASTGILGAGIAVGVLSVVGVKFVIEHCFAGAAWKRNLKQPFIGSIVLGTALAGALCVLDASILQSGIVTANVFSEYMTGPNKSGISTSSWAVSFAVTGPVMAVSATRGWIYGWASHRRAQIEAWRTCELRQRIPIQDILDARISAQQERKTAQGLQAAREAAKEEVNQWDAYFATKKEEELSHLSTYIEGLTDQQLDVLNASTYDIIRNVARLMNIIEALQRQLLPASVQRAMPLPPQPEPLPERIRRWWKGDK